MTRTREKTRLAAVATLAAAALLTTLAAPGWADFYPYDTDLEVCEPSTSNCADDTPTVNSAPFKAGDKVAVSFDLDTLDDSETTADTHDWLGNGSGGDWEDGRAFRISVALPSSSAAFGSGFQPFDCYSNSVARRSPLVRSSGEANPNNPIDGAGNAGEGATHAGEPVIGGHVLKLSNPQSGTVTSTRHPSDTVVATDANDPGVTEGGKFVVDAELPGPLEFPAAYQTGEALLCVESVDLYGDEGNVGVEDGSGNRFETGVGLHCADNSGSVQSGCFNQPVGSAQAYSEDGMCNPFCETYNSTPRIQAAVKIAVEP